MKPSRSSCAALLASALVCWAGTCGGGKGGGDDGGASFLGGSGTPGVAATQTCAGSCAQTALSVAHVQTILTQAVSEAQAQGVAATIAVVDRVGNVLAVFQMTGASVTTTIPQINGTSIGLAGSSVPSTLAAISKADTAAFLSSQGNAFTTRTASQIVQEHFNPAESFQPGGPLFGVQLSQLPCGDLVRRFGVQTDEGPKRMPLGLSADPGGLPLYINGVPVGGVGVELDGDYSLDANPADVDSHVEERIAGAASRSFEAPSDRRAERIAVAGKFLRFVDDVSFASAALGGLAGGTPGGGSLVAVSGFAAASVVAGTTLLTNASGVVATSYDGEPAEILVDNAGVSFPAANPRASTSPTPGSGGLSADEVRILVREALKVARAARAQIRRPSGSAARVNVAVVDLAGALLGFARSPDAPIFGIDVSLQKARTAAFLSKSGAATDLNAANPSPVNGSQTTAQYVTDLRAFLGDATALANGIAFSDRSVGNLARPFFPDGIDGNPNGPLSQPLTQWSPFSTGLQLDLVIDQLLASLASTAITSCTGGAPLEELAGGIQIFPGSVPIFKNGVLVGGIGISGDGVDQDDMVAFLGLHNASQLAPGIGNAPAAIRADTLSPGGVHLRYVSCPASPFLDSSAQNVCDGL